MSLLLKLLIIWFILLLLICCFFFRVKDESPDEKIYRDNLEVNLTNAIKPPKSKKMNTNEKILKWLGFIKYIHRNLSEEEIISYKHDSIDMSIKDFDFLHDRNQQKWIEDKITEKYYLQYYTVDNNKWVVLIEERFSPPDYEPLASGMDESKDLAFISAVEQLIDKETNKT